MSKSSHLRGLLERFDDRRPPFPSLRERMLQLCDAGGEAFSRRHFQPGHFTASGFVVDPARARAVLIHHGKLHRWLQPGGHVEPDDADVVAAARRELREEVGLTELPLHSEAPGIFDLDIHLIPPRGDEPAHQHFDVRFLFVSAAQPLHAASDARAARWVDLDAVQLLESDPSVMRAVRAIQMLLSRCHLCYQGPHGD